MRCDTEVDAADLIIPPFVKVLRDVTNDKEYQTGYMARKEYKMPIEDVKNILI